MEPDVAQSIVSSCHFSLSGIACQTRNLCILAHVRGTFSTLKLWLKTRFLPFPCMCNSLAARLHCSWIRMLRHNRIIVLESFWRHHLSWRFTEGDVFFFRRELFRPRVYVGREQAHFHRGSHRDSAEPPRGHKMPQTGTAVELILGPEGRL